jgi:glycosyltransferase involved in cell wall biosynthesis
MNCPLLVSVIIPFLNTEEFLQEAIKSVFEQTYDTWELLLVDDGSSDHSSEIAQRYAKHSSGKVRYLEHPRHENRGACAARNLGISHAAGEYVAFLDADDIWLPKKLEEQVVILQANPEAGMVYGATQYWNSWTGSCQVSDYVPELGVDPNQLVRSPTLLTLFLESKAPTPCPSDLLIRRELLERIGGFEDSFRGIYQLFEDQVFLAKVYLNADVFVADRCWDKYRLHPDSCVARVTQAGQKRVAALSYLKWLACYLREQGIEDIRVWQALQKKRRRYRHPMLYYWLGRLEHGVDQMKRMAARRPLASRRP